jgi:hypothetical protein
MIPDWAFDQYCNGSSGDLLAIQVADPLRATGEH